MNKGWTPIKVPGKRKYAPQGSAAENSNKSKAPKWIGRPFKPKTSSATSSTNSSRSSTPSSPRKHRSMKRLKSKRAMSSLERLPTEILERVFLFALNFDMPRASPILAGKLGSRYIHIETIVAAFGSTWGQRYACIKHGDPDLSEMIPEEIPGDSRLQSAILRCRWSSLDILRMAETTWLRRKALEESKRLKGKLLAGNQASEKSESSVPVVMETSDSGNAMEESHPTSRWSGRTEDNLFEDDYSQIRVQVEAPQTEHDTWIPAPPRKLNGFLLIHPETDIPDSLLRGPWTEDMVQYLFWLFRAGARIRWLESTSGEVAAAGLETAIWQGNLLVLFLFHCFGVQQCLTLEMMNDALRAGKGDRLAVVTRLMVMAQDKDQDLMAAWEHQLAIVMAGAARKSNGSSALLEMARLLGRRWDELISMRSSS